MWRYEKFGYELFIFSPLCLSCRDSILIIIIIIREEGSSAFLKGLAPRIMIIAPLFAITFMVFEKLQRHFAPQTKVPLQNMAVEFDLVRDSRLKHITSKLDSEFGLQVAR